MFKLSAWVLSALLVTGISLTSQGQEVPYEQEQQTEQFIQKFEELKKSLNLTRTQENEAKPVLIESIKKRQEILKSFGFEQGKDRPELSFREKRELGKKLREQKEETSLKLSRILQEPQMEKLKEFQQESRDMIRSKIAK